MFMLTCPGYEQGLLIVFLGQTVHPDVLHEKKPKAVGVATDIVSLPPLLLLVAHG
jgi:hypothetical protein